MDRWTIGRLLETVTPYLRQKGSTSPRLDAELLLAAALGVERIELYTQYDRPLEPAELGAYRALIARRAAHEPVAYILGRAYFRHLCLEVGPAVLIPRPETEELVEVALEILRRRPPLGRPAAADVGTGSGAIALSLAQEAGVRVLATDRSAEALAVAARNAERLGLSHLVEFRQVDLLGLGEEGTESPPVEQGGPEAASLHLVVSNPPYVARPDLAALAPDVRDWEPLAALDGGADGLQVLRRLVPQAARALAPGGTLLVEVGSGQAVAVQELAREAGFALSQVHKDLSGKDRIVEATMPGVLEITLDSLEGADAAALRAALAAGAVIGVPTDTVYGLAARWDSPAGVRRLFQAKGRPPEQPVAVLFPSVAAVTEALPDLEPRARSVLEALLPGPYTFVVGTDVERPTHVGTEDSLGVRVPDHPGLLEFLAGLGVPLVATSANFSGGPAAATLSEVDPRLLAHCSVALAESPGGFTWKGGLASSAWVASPAGVVSTVVDLRPLSRGEAPLVLREGAVPGARVLARIQELG